MKKNIALLGSGGREHAFAWKMAQSPKLGKLYILPGNAGTARCGENVDIASTDFPAIKDFVLTHQIQMVVVGPEDPLVKGVHDFFLNDPLLRDIPVIGPQSQGAMLEGSKDFSKQFMFRHGVPTAKYATFRAENIQEGYTFLDTLNPPYVLKADGLAAGKGVLILDDVNQAKTELKNMLQHSKFGSAGNTVVIEEYLHGIELSVFVLTDGKSYKILPAAKDYKRIGDADAGLNTGGMGAVSPVPFANAEFLKKVEDRVVKPTISGLQKDGIPYKGFIFIGLMNCKGDPFVIEYNVRMGDPETEVVLPRITSDIIDLFEGVANQTLAEKSYAVTDETAVTVMLVSGGYPEDYEKGKTITGEEYVEDTLVFHAGSTNKNGKIVTAGGRVIALTSFGNDILNARQKSYKAADHIHYEGKYHRTDIGLDLIEYINKNQQ